MFEEFSGIPLHPLLVHAAVIFVPLQVLFAILYAVLPATRRYIWWAVLALAVVGPITAWAARLSGAALRARDISRGGTGNEEFLVKFDAHQGFGEMTSYFATGLGVLMLVLVLVVAKRPTEADPAPTPSAAPSTTLPSVVSIGSAVVVVLVALATGYYIFRTGDTGAHMVWDGR